MESVPGNQKIERILSDILIKLERIEEKIDEPCTLRNLPSGPRM